MWLGLEESAPQHPGVLLVRSSSKARGARHEDRGMACGGAETDRGCGNLQPCGLAGFISQSPPS